jgi:hypothetical protein
MAEHSATVPDVRAQSYVEQSDDNAGDARTRHERILKQAKDDFKIDSKWESHARKNFLEDIKFANADAYNGYQWPNDIRRNRDVDERPCLTINKTRQHNLQIVNDAKKNKPAIKIRATGNGATAEAASMHNAIMRHIEYRSNATVAYDVASTFQVNGGVGYLRIGTRHISEDSFDQEPYIMPVPDPLNIVMDSGAKEVDKSDANRCFIFEDVPKEDFEGKYPEYKDIAAAQNVVSDDAGWVTQDSIRTCEYFRRVQKKDTLFAYTDKQSKQTAYIRKSVLEDAPELLRMIEADPRTKSRETTTTTIEWYFIVGNTIVEEETWPGKYIPIVPVIGEETVIDGIMDRKGHTRALIDPQRMYNYWASTAVEYGALQTKSPWMAPAEAIEGYETYWETANKINHSVLPYNGLNDAGEAIPAPQRVEPPVAAPVALTGMQLAQGDFMMASGQYQDSMGERSNERSAKAINERQRQGDTATYHFIDNLAIAIRHIGKILLDLIPKLYDTKRIMRIMAEDGTDFELEIDPQAAQVYAKRLAHDGSVAAHILNPMTGTYEVEADIGPSWGTKREEAFNALTLILTQAPQLTSLIGDLLLKSSDFDLSDEAAARLRRMVPPQALGQGPSPQEQALQGQVTQITQLLQKTMEELSREKLKGHDRSGKHVIDSYNAFTQRLKVFLDDKARAAEAIQPDEIKALVSQTMQESLEAHLGDEAASDEAESTGVAAPKANGQGGPIALPKGVVENPPVPGARKGADGHWYVKNYAKTPGAYSLVG